MTTYPTRVACFIAIAATLTRASSLPAQISDSTRRAAECRSCAVWNAPQEPLRVFGNTYYVGTHGLSSILITSDSGDVLIDGGLPESAPVIMAHIRALGLKVEDVKLILNSHDHFDHAGGIAALQHASGAQVAASASSAAVLERGASGPDDPQYGIALPMTPAHDVKVIKDEQTLHVGSNAITAHFTPGHTPGGTSWTWRSCEKGRCADIAYVDSQTPVSADSFYFTHSTTYPNAIHDFEHSFTVIENLPCDILLTPHPEASDLWTRIAKRDGGDESALFSKQACRQYASSARINLAARIADERKKQ